MGMRKGNGYKRAVVTVSHEDARKSFIDLALQLMTDKRVKSNKGAVNGLIAALYQIVNTYNVAGAAGKMTIHSELLSRNAGERLAVFLQDKVKGFEGGSYLQAMILNVFYLQGGVSIWPEGHRKALLNWTSNGQSVPSAESLGQFYDHFASVLSRTKPKSTWTVRRNRLQAKGHHR